MSSPQHAGFSKRYAVALHRHMRASVRTRPGSHGARALAGRAIALRIDALALSRIHQQVLAAFDRFAPHPARITLPGHLGRAGRFFLEVLAPIVKRQAVDSQNLRLRRQLAAESKSRLSDTSTLRRQLKREIARRTSCEARLELGARHYRHLLAQSQRTQEQSRRLARQLILDQEEERKEISRDLHDDVAQILAGINVQLAGLRESAAINDRELRRRIAQAQRLVGQSVEAVHRFARELRPALLDDLGLIPALRSFIRSMPSRDGLRIEFDAFRTVEDIGATERTVLYRVAQEALTNVVRHAHAHVATVRITKQIGRVCLAIHDDGRSFQAERALASRSNHRLGLVGMRERVEMVGGTFTIDSTPGRGTTVRADIPLRQNGSKHP